MLLVVVVAQQWWYRGGDDGGNSLCKDGSYFMSTIVKCTIGGEDCDEGDDKGAGGALWLWDQFGPTQDFKV